MAPFMANYSGQTYSILRIIAGLMFLFIAAHGAGRWSADDARGAAA